MQVVSYKYPRKPYKFLARKGSLVVIRNDFGRVILTHRKKLRRDNRRRKGKGASVLHKPLVIMSKYTIRNFLEDMDKISEEMEIRDKKEGIGKIVGSLLRPLPEVLGAVCEKQKK